MAVDIGSRSTITARSATLYRNISILLVCRKSAAAVYVVQITVNWSGLLF